MSGFNGIMNRSGQVFNRDDQVGTSLGNFSVVGGIKNNGIEETRNISVLDKITDGMVEDLTYSLGCVVGDYAHDLRKTADYAWDASYLMQLAGERVNNKN